MYSDFISLIKDTYPGKKIINLHEPKFIGNEKKYLEESINSSYVSSVGPFVNDFENKLAAYLNIKNVILTTNGTSALHIALKLAGAREETEVITQSLTFVATSNAIHYCNANPVFIDVDKSTLGLSANALENFLNKNCYLDNKGKCWNKKTKRKIVACLPMHTYGFPVEIIKIKEICDNYSINLVEDAAEGMGSYYKDIHLGTFGKLGTLSFNGNKIITSGNGGAIVTNDDELAKKAKHLTTTARKKHKWHINHDKIGYNYRMSNISAAVGLAQLESLDFFLDNKRALAKKYQSFGEKNDLNFFKENNNSKVNYWLNVLIASDKKERDLILETTNENNIMTRPAWTPMHMLPMNNKCDHDSMENTEFLFDRIINVPSSVTDV